MPRDVIWFIPNLISTDLTKNYSRLQDYLVSKFGYNKIIVTNDVLDQVNGSVDIFKTCFLRTRYGYYHNFVKLLRFCKKGNIFLIYDNSIWMLIFSILSKMAFGITVVVKLDSSLENGTLTKKKAFLFRQVDLILYESKNSKKKLENENVNNSMLLYNGLVLEDINSIKNGLVEKEKSILFAGRITKEKQVNLLIDVFLDLNLEGYTLNICGPMKETGDRGTTAYHDEFLEKIKNNKNVKYHGALYGDDYLEQFKKAEVFVLPSLTEGLPNVLSYALFSKCLIMATDVGSVTEYLNDGNAIMFKGTSKENIKSGLRQVLEIDSQSNHKDKINSGYEFAMKELNYENQFQKICLELIK